MNGNGTQHIIEVGRQYVYKFSTAGQGIVVLTKERQIAKRFPTHASATRWARRYADAGFGLVSGHYTVVPLEAEVQDSMVVVTQRVVNKLDDAGARIEDCVRMLHDAGNSEAAASLRTVLGRLTAWQIANTK